MTTAPPMWTDRYFDAATMSLRGAIYADYALYRLELERVFARSWLYLGHESKLPQPNDFVRAFMAEDEVIVSRRGDGSIVAFLNQCRHRGARLCRADDGHAARFTCPYHGWPYGSDGRLLAVPHEAFIYPERVDRDEWSAVRVPRVEVLDGLIFGCWDAETAPLEESLGDFLPYWRANLSRSDATEVIGGVHKWRVRCNWKLPSEQFASDIYHFGVTHASAMTAHLPPGFEPPLAGPPMGRQARSSGGHGGGFGADRQVSDGVSMLTVGPQATAYLTGAHRDRAIERLGEPMGSDLLGIHMTVFPNLSYLPTNQSLRVWHPRGPNEIEVWAWTLVDRDAPPEVKEAIRTATGRTFGTSGVFEQDDSENWAEIARSLRGSQARQTRLHVGMGLNQSHDPEGRAPGTTDHVVSEAAARSFYGHWARLLAAGPAPEQSA